MSDINYEFPQQPNIIGIIVDNDGNDVNFQITNGDEINLTYGHINPNGFYIASLNNDGLLKVKLKNSENETVLPFFKGWNPILVSEVIPYSGNTVTNIYWGSSSFLDASTRYEPLQFNVSFTSETDLTVSMPFVEGYNYNCYVDYGDGSDLVKVRSFDDANATHIYAGNPSIQTHTISIYGLCEGFYTTFDATITPCITEVLSWGNNGFKKLSFIDCYNLTTIPDGSQGLSSLIDCQDMFAGCALLTSIPENLFKYNTELTDYAFYSTFYGCTSLTSIPAGLFSGNTLVGNYGFVDTFSGCNGITSISEDLFKYNTLVGKSGFRGTFKYLQITSIPENLFKYNTLVGDYGFMYTFYACSSLTSIPQNLFKYNTLVGESGFQNTFSDCTSLTSIPENLFKYNTLVSGNGFETTFYNCTSLTSIPAGLFSTNTLVGNSAFYGTFTGCQNIASIPVGLFSGNTLVGEIGFASTFEACISLTSIPEDLFKYNTLVNYGGFNGTFTNCTSLTSIPQNLFKYNTLVGDYGFGKTFFGCISLTSIPENLFKYNTLVGENGFEDTFNYCTSLTSIPENLFKYNTLVGVNGFNTCFENCSSLTELPYELFKYNTSDNIGFYGTFRYCDNLKLNQYLFCSSGETSTRFLNKTVDFTECFFRNQYNNVESGIAPDLWNYDFGTATPITTDCFGGSGNDLTSISNYNDIPAEWK